MDKKVNRRNAVKSTALGSMGLSLLGASAAWAQGAATDKKKIGIIGLDTSHSLAFAKAFNRPDAGPEMGGYKVVAAYPYGSREIESSYSRIPKYTKGVTGLGVKIVDSIDELIEQVDVVLLETNDGRLHLEQALPVMKAGRTVFIDKPIAASLSDAMIIFEKAKQYSVPVFSSSSLRYTENVQAVCQGKIGAVTGASTYSPCPLEPTHPDLFWYGIHGVEMLYAVMGTGCRQVTRIYSPDTDTVVGIWEDGRMGTFRGNRTGKHAYGGTAFSENDPLELGPYESYKMLLREIVKFFQTGIAPVAPEETLEILAFMEAADESRRLGGASAEIREIFKRAEAKAKAEMKKYA